METLAQKLHIDGEQANAICTAGFDLLDTGNADGACAIFEGLHVLNPNDSSVIAGLGAVAEAKGDTERAAELYQKAIAIRPELAFARLKLGLLKLAKNDPSGLEDLRVAAQGNTSASARAKAILSVRKV